MKSYSFRNNKNGLKLIHELRRVNNPTKIKYEQ